jgi:N-methylhydantoinase B
MGLDYALTVLPPEAVLTSRGMERYVFQPWGREGGRPGASGQAILATTDGGQRELGKIDVIRMPPRSTLCVQTAGGGGYGDAFARDPALVLADVLDGLVSPERARQDYGVAIVGDTIDERATAELRRSPRPPGERFSFGDNRVAFEQRWPDALQAAVNRLTAGLTAAPRQYVRERLIEAIESSRARGQNLDDALLGALYRQVMGTLQVPLLETL